MTVELSGKVLVRLRCAVPGCGYRAAQIVEADEGCYLVIVDAVSARYPSASIGPRTGPMDYAVPLNERGEPTGMSFSMHCRRGGHGRLHNPPPGVLAAAIHEARGQQKTISLMLGATSGPPPPFIWDGVDLRTVPREITD